MEEGAVTTTAEPGQNRLDEPVCLPPITAPSQPVCVDGDVADRPAETSASGPPAPRREDRWSGSDDPPPPRPGPTGPISSTPPRGLARPVPMSAGWPVPGPSAPATDAPLTDPPATAAVVPSSGAAPATPVPSSGAATAALVPSSGPATAVAVPPSGPRPASATRRWGVLDRWKAMTLLMATLVAGLVVYSAVLTRELGRIRTTAHDDRNAALAAEQRLNRSLNEQISSLSEANNGLSRRIAAMENRPDQAKVIAAAKPSVFTVTAGSATGSAFVFQVDGDRSGLITNLHVVDAVMKAGGEPRVTIENDSYRKMSAMVVKTDADNDLALLVVEAKLPALPKAPNDPQVGDPVIVLGSPVGLGGSASTGIVSAQRGNRWQFTAPASPGNSGGPLLNQEGQVIGVTTSKVSAQNVEGISFAVTVQTVCRTVLTC